MLVRDAVPEDAAACAAIYAPYVEQTAISFELVAPTAVEMAARIAAAQRTHAWLVAEVDGTGDSTVTGYAYGGPYKQRAAYRWSCEVSVYVDRARHRAGAGKALYSELFDRLAARGYHTAVAGMTQPNEASGGLHRAMGFEPIGTYRGIGWKHDAWHDVTWTQRVLTTAREPAELVQCPAPETR